MINHSNQIFRITYEAFSKFSNNLNRCRSFDDVTECLTVNLKYLFNYHIYRASYLRNNIFVHLLSICGKTTISVSDQPHYLEYEKQLINEELPKKWYDLYDLDLPASFYLVEDEQPELWGWNLGYGDRRIIVSVFSGSEKKFTQKDITFLKLASENLEAKLFELCLIKELDEKNNIISSINRNQKKVIEERTREIEIKNKTLIEILVLNGHSVREPLSRILGLVNILEDDQSEELIKEICPLIKISANDLDIALKNVIRYATKELSQIKV